MSGLLDHIRILDFSRVMSGPYCTALLADLGAEVVKVEEPIWGDQSRSFGPHISDVSAYFALLNRRKRSITLDLKNPRSQEVAQKLAAQADVVVENFRPGVADRLGIGYDQLRAVKPDLIYCSISGFGQDGPLAQLPAYDLMIQAMSGLMSVTGPEDGRPTAVGESIADVAAGMFASWGILAALTHRASTGNGCQLDVAMLDSVFSMLVTPLSRELYTDQEAKRRGNRHPETYPVDSFATADGEIVIAGTSDAAVRSLGSAISVPDLADDPRFANNASRNEHESELRELISSWTEVRSSQDALDALWEAGVPAAPVLSIKELLDHPHIRHRKLVTMGQHDVLGEVPLVEQPVRFTCAQDSKPATVPKLGGDSGDVLSSWLGLSPEERRALAESGALGPDVEPG